MAVSSVPRGSEGRTWSLQRPRSLSPRHNDLTNALRRLGSGWALFVEASRQTAQRYPDSKLPDPVSALVDTERRAQFEEEGAHFETAYYSSARGCPTSAGPPMAALP
jgi:type IV secretory pathway VirB4 component